MHLRMLSLCVNYDLYVWVGHSAKICLRRSNLISKETDSSNLSVIKIPSVVILFQWTGGGVGELNGYKGGWDQCDQKKIAKCL